ncbi:hypothetical protein A245_07844 [Pseudomonas syringae pv. actinidiae ICMP 19096]|uniref:DUF2934 domain-containing protein n=1 Tax=Pseudomonas syringae pv. actinidiae ICMP 19096 TaxID=1194405 RepID=A0A656K2D6_PSESF|nr:hypothetical protein A245_07844 [Pseudomonas syringae pv. actinidiae ICMP 19096]
MSADEKRIRDFAYQIWESEGKPSGHDERHWEMARKLAEAEALAPNKSTVRKSSKPKLPEVDSAKAPAKGAAKPVAKSLRRRPMRLPRKMHLPNLLLRRSRASRQILETLLARCQSIVTGPALIQRRDLL